MKYLFLLLFLVGCTAENDLLDIATHKKECAAFKKTYDEVKPKDSTIFINMKISGCKSAGAWE